MSRLHLSPGYAWVRIGRYGPGIHLKDWARNRPIFSDRHGFRIRIWRGWHLKLLMPIPRPLRGNL